MIMMMMMTKMSKSGPRINKASSNERPQPFIKFRFHFKSTIMKMRMILLQSDLILMVFVMVY